MVQGVGDLNDKGKYRFTIIGEKQNVFLICIAICSLKKKKCTISPHPSLPAPP